MNDYEIWQIGNTQMAHGPSGPQLVYDFEHVVNVGLTKEDALRKVNSQQRVVHKNVQGVWEIVEA